MGFFSKKKKKGKAKEDGEAADSTEPEAATDKTKTTSNNNSNGKSAAGASSKGQQNNPNSNSTPGASKANAAAPAGEQRQQQQQKAPPTTAQQQQQPAPTQEQQPPPSAAAAAADNINSSSVTDLPVGDPEMARAEVTRDLVKKFISDIWNRGELELIPNVCSPKIRFNGNTGLDKIGHDGFARMVATIHGALSDYHCEIHSMVVENNKAFCRLRFSGKHTGDLLGYPPTGRVVSWMGATEFTCINGRILKVWELGDMKTLEEQLQLH